MGTGAVLAFSGCTTMTVSTGPTYITSPSEQNESPKQMNAAQRQNYAQRDPGTSSENAHLNDHHLKDADQNPRRRAQESVEMTDPCPTCKNSESAGLNQNRPQSENKSPGSDPALQSENGESLSTNDFGQTRRSRQPPSQDEREFFEELSKQDPEFSSSRGNEDLALNRDLQDKSRNTPSSEDRSSGDFSSSEKESIGLYSEQNLPENESESESGENQERNFHQIGTASWYGQNFNGKKTASGEVFNSRKLTAAHKEIPLGSIVLVRNMENGKEVLVRVNDRGPFVEGRIIDLSEYGSELLGFKNKGLATVGIRVVKKGQKTASGSGLTEEYFAVGSDDQEAEEAEKSLETEADYITAALGGGTTGATKRTSRKKELPGSPELPTSVPSAQQQEGFSVQVGAFQDLRNAANLKKYLSDYGVPVGIYRNEGQYVVRAGKFRARFHAEQLKYQLVSDGYSAFIIEPEKLSIND